MVNEKAITQGSKIISDGGTWFGETINSIVQWFSNISIFELIIIVIIIILTVVLIYLRSKLKNTSKPRYKYN